MESIKEKNIALFPYALLYGIIDTNILGCTDSN